MPLSLADVLEIRAELFAEDIEPPALTELWTEQELRAFFESGGASLPAHAIPPPPYQMDMFGRKRGRCLKDASCPRYEQRNTLYKTEGATGLAGAMCARCNLENLVHEDLGCWVKGEPQLVTVEGERFRWEMVVENNRPVTKKIQM